MLAIFKLKNRGPPKNTRNLSVKKERQAATKRLCIKHTRRVLSGGLSLTKKLFLKIRGKDYHTKKLIEA